MNLNQPDHEIPQPSISLTPGSTNNFGSVEEGKHGGKKIIRSKVGVLAAINIRWWNKIFVISSVIAVTLDPLFFYIPIIDEEKKCLAKDKKLMTATLLLRSLTDIIFLVHFVYHIYEAIKTKNTTAVASISHKVKGTAKTTPLLKTGRINLGLKSEQQAGAEFAKYVQKKSIAKKLSWLYLSIAIEFFGLLPIPQVLIIVVFYKTKGLPNLECRKVLNLILLGQYLPKIYRIHLSSKELTKTVGIWIKGLFNFFLYILASHVFGAFWYFFSIQLETSCWYRACINNDNANYEGCMSTFYCDGAKTTSTAANITDLINKQCANTSEGVSHGIFHDFLKNHNVDHIKFARKLFYSFWWGLRNLSNFGTNLLTNTSEWENFYAILISIVGLLLFLYLIGNVQTFMQMETSKLEKIRRQKRKLKELDVQNWISSKGLPNLLNKEIMNNIRNKLEDNKDADLQNLFSILPWQTKKYLKHCLCINTLRTVPKLATMNETVLKKICDYLKPVMYNENSFVFRMGDPLDYMIFIVEGTILTFSTNEDSEGENSSSHMDTNRLLKGQYYGEELLNWASATFHSKLPTSTHHVKSHTKVEAFALMAKDLTTVISKCQTHWDLNNCANSQEQEDTARSTITTAIRLRLSMSQRSNRPAVVAPTRLIRLRTNSSKMTSNYLQSPHY